MRFISDGFEIVNPVDGYKSVNFKNNPKFSGSFLTNRDWLFENKKHKLLIRKFEYGGLSEETAKSLELISKKDIKNIYN